MLPTAPNKSHFLQCGRVRRNCSSVKSMNIQNYSPILIKYTGRIILVNNFAQINAGISNKNRPLQIIARRIRRFSLADIKAKAHITRLIYLTICF